MEEFRAAVSAGLMHKRVLSVTSVPGMGTLCDLGAWVKRPQRLPNPSVSRQLQEFKGMDSLYVRCEWELYSPTDLLPEGVPLAGQLMRMALLEALTGATVESVTFVADGLSMVLGYDNAMKLTLFPELRNFGDGGYTVGLENVYWTVESGGALFANALDGT